MRFLADRIVSSGRSRPAHGTRIGAPSTDEFLHPSRPRTRHPGRVEGSRRRRQSGQHGLPRHARDDGFGAAATSEAFILPPWAAPPGSRSGRWLPSCSSRIDWTGDPGWSCRARRRHRGRTRAAGTPSPGRVRSGTVRTRRTFSTSIVRHGDRLAHLVSRSRSAILHVAVSPDGHPNRWQTLGSR